MKCAGWTNIQCNEQDDPTFLQLTTQATGSSNRTAEGRSPAGAAAPLLLHGSAPAAPLHWPAGCINVSASSAQGSRMVTVARMATARGRRRQRA